MASGAPNREPSRLSRGKKILFAAAAVLLALALLELTARAIEIRRPPRTADIGAGFLPGSRVFVASPGRPGWVETAAEKRLAFRTQEFEVPKARGTLRVFVLGGSSVNYLDDELAELEKQLWHTFEPRWSRVEVINVGGMSYGSARMVTIASEVLGYDPDVVVLYEANNEFEELEQKELASLGTVGLQRALSLSAAVRLAQDLVVAHEVDRLQRDQQARQEAAGATPARARAWRHTFTQAEADDRMRAFRDNYATIIDTYRARGTPIVLATVPSNLVRPALRGPDLDAYAAVWTLLEQKRFAEADELGRKILAACAGRHQSSDVENAIIRDLVRQRGVPMADVEAVIRAAEPHHVPGETLFKDHCHLTAAGNRMLREALAAVVIDVLRAAAAVQPERR